MNILHLLSQTHLTGAEVYAAQLADHQNSSGHRVFQISNGFYYKTPAIQIQLEVETRSKTPFLSNIFFLRNFLRKHAIHVVHTHSRAAAKLAYWATLGTDTGLVSTVHGVQHSSFSKKLFNQYGRFIIAVCENIKNHLIKDFSYDERVIKVIPNLIDGNRFHFLPPSTGPVRKIAVIGRTTGPKRERTELVLKALEGCGYDITLIGGSLGHPGVTESSETELNSAVYSRYDLIVGSGRVCMEALMSGVRTIAFGEACYVGPVTAANFNEALKSNFGDIHPGSKNPALNAENFRRDLMADFGDLAALAKTAAAEFSVKSVAARVLRTYESAYFLKNHPQWIPVLMYHKIPDHELQSQHKIYVTKERFEKHLHYFKRSGFTTLTFSDLKKFRTGEKSFSEFPQKPLVLTFDDGYRDNLENASPRLKAHGFKAQIFLLADPGISSNKWDHSGTEPAHEIVSGSERKKWLGSAFEIGSHGFSHRKITELSGAEALAELVDSKNSLEKEFGAPVVSYAFTYGVTSENSSALAESAGYDYAVNTDSGGLLMEENPYAVFRANIFPDESLFSLWKKTSPWYRRYYHFKRHK